MATKAIIDNHGSTPSSTIPVTLPELNAGIMQALIWTSEAARYAEQAAACAEHAMAMVGPLLGPLNERIERNRLRAERQNAHRHHGHHQHNGNGNGNGHGHALEPIVKITNHGLIVVCRKCGRAVVS